MPKPVVLLVNPNRMLPPVAPIGLEYLATILRERGFEPVLCDLTWADDWSAALQSAISDARPFAVGISIRNIDDAYFATQDFVLDHTAQVIRRTKELTDAPVLVGGVGFSVAPAEILAYTGADLGVAGEGEATFPVLLGVLLSSGGIEAFQAIPGVVYRNEAGHVVVNKPTPVNLAHLPASSRRFVDNVRYFKEGGLAGVETLRGCPQVCVYCVDPLAKGRLTRVRPPTVVGEEICDLLEQDIDVIHLCDCEFNLEPNHCWMVCQHLIEQAIPKRLRWYAYAMPYPFNEDLALEMARAGCVGINFGVDHGDNTMLRRLGRNHNVEDIRVLGTACRRAGIATMFDLLLGSPGETRETIERTLDLMREVAPDRAGISLGIRVYPHTRLAQTVRNQGPMETNPNLHGHVQDNQNFLKPVFYIDHNLGPDIHQYVSRLVAGEKRFLHTDPTQVDGNYNYNNNAVLVQAIKNGARGAYWDILRKLE